MSELVTLELPTELVQRARAVAAATNRRLEDVVTQWIERAAEEPAVEDLPDDRVLSLSEEQLPETIQSELSDLLASNRAGSLPDTERARLDELLAIYRRGLVLKARATKEAVSRGLKPRLGDHAA
jgi:hypothetical protein